MGITIMNRLLLVSIITLVLVVPSYGAGLTMFSGGENCSILDSSYDTGTDNEGVSSSYPQYSQSWASSGGTLDRITVRLKKQTASAGTVAVSVYDHTGTFGTNSLPTGTPVVSNSLNAADLADTDTPYVRYTFYFTGANRKTLVSGTNYVLVFIFTDPTGGMKIQNNGSGAAAGNEAYYIAATEAWTPEAGKDILHEVYVCK